MTMIRRFFAATFPLGTAVILVSCASGTRSGSPRPSGPIGYVELHESGAASVLEAVRILRPSWTSRLVGAFVDGREMTDEELEVEPVENIAEIRFLTGSEATARLGVTPQSSLAGYLLIVRRR